MPIRFLTQNVMMLPGPGGEQRGRDLVAAILKASPRYDVLCLQEVFDEDIRRILSRGLYAQFPHRVIKCDDGDLFQEDSGLFFASRYPIHDSEEQWGAKRRGWGFEEFEESSGLTTGDYWADKGIFGARLNLGTAAAGAQLLVFNTHLQSDPSTVGQYREVRAAQLRQIRMFVARACARLPNKAATAALLFGDMNVAGETDEHTAMLTRLGGPRDLFRELSKAPGYTWDGTSNQLIPADDRDRLRLDYALAFDHIPDVGNPAFAGSLRACRCLATAVEQLGTTAKTRLSDHFGVSVTVDL